MEQPGGICGGNSNKRVRKLASVVESVNGTTKYDDAPPGGTRMLRHRESQARQATTIKIIIC